MSTNESLDLFKFCLDKAYVETGLFYTRGTVFTTLLTLLAGFVLKEMIPEGRKSANFGAALIMVSVLGLSVSVAWFFVNRQSILYNRAWLANARQIANGDTSLKNAIDAARDLPGMREQSASPREWVQFWCWPASRWFQMLAVIFAIFWSVLLLKGINIRCSAT